MGCISHNIKINFFLLSLVFGEGIKLKTLALSQACLFQTIISTSGLADFVSKTHGLP